MVFHHRQGSTLLHWDRPKVLGSNLLSLNHQRIECHLYGSTMAHCPDNIQESKNHCSLVGAWDVSNSVPLHTKKDSLDLV